MIRTALVKAIIWGALFHAPVFAQAENSSSPIHPFKAIYTSEWDIGIAVNGEVERSLTQTPQGEWLFRTFANTMVASIDESSLVSFAGNEVIPHEYLYKKKVLGRKREATLSFDWQAMSVNNNIDHKPWKMDIPLHTQDKHSYQLQMRIDLKSGKRGPFTYQIADGGRLKEYDFKVIGEEVIESPLGKFDTIKVEMDRGPNASRETFIWYAPALDFMIVKLKQTEADGKVYALQLKSMETR